MTCFTRPPPFSFFPRRLLCRNEGVTGEAVSQLLAVRGAAALAQAKSKDGSLPLHALCSNPATGPAALAAFLAVCPKASATAGAWGMLPLHCLCANDSAGGDSVDVVASCYPAALDAEDGQHHAAVHYVCERRKPGLMVRQR